MKDFPAIFPKPEVVAQRCSIKKVFLEISQNSTVASACNFIKKEALAQVFFSEFCEISKNAFSYRTPPVVASVKLTIL